MKTKGLIIVNTGYGKGKTTAALGMAFRALGHGLPVCITRCGNFYGGGDLNFSRLIPEATVAVIDGRPPVIRSDGSPERDFLHVDDAVSAYLALEGSLASGQTVDKLELHKVRAESVVYRGKKAVHLTQTPDAKGEETLAIVAGSEFQDGTIEVEVAGAPAAGAFGGARGFIGVAFRVRPDAAKFELLYLRPTNGRAEDQLSRNHSTQYTSFPDWPWHRLRQETPGLYESYVDLEPGAWTKVGIVGKGTKARLYVHGADQACLVVKDLKLEITKGAVGLWIGPGTDGYFANLRLTPEND